MKKRHNFQDELDLIDFLIENNMIDADEASYIRQQNISQMRGAL